jgi:hypothetical protein
MHEPWQGAGAGSVRSWVQQQFAGPLASGAALVQQHDRGLASSETTTREFSSVRIIAGSRGIVLLAG